MQYNNLFTLLMSSNNTKSLNYQLIFFVAGYLLIYLYSILGHSRFVRTEKQNPI